MGRSVRSLWCLGLVALLAGAGLTMSWRGPAPAVAVPRQEGPPFVVEPTEGYPGDKVAVSDLSCPIVALFVGRITFHRTTVEADLGGTTVLTVPDIPSGPTDIRFDCEMAPPKVTPPDPSLVLTSSAGRPGVVTFTILDLPDFSASVSPDTAAAGDTVSVSGVGCTTGNTVQAVLGESVRVGIGRC